MLALGYDLFPLGGGELDSTSEAGIAEVRRLGGWAGSVVWNYRDAATQIRPRID